MRIAIAGASGNLGLFLSTFLSELSHDPILLTHKRKLPHQLIAKKNVCVKSVDLGDPASLKGCCDGAECIISMAGVLFKGGPEKFLPVTNTVYVTNLAREAVSAKINKFVLLSFPHVEGETFPDSRALGLIPAEDPKPLHAKTRLDAERLLIETCESTEMKYLILRTGVVYGKGVKLIEAARRMMHLSPLAIWGKPTWVHLIHVDDFLNLARIGIEDPRLEGILNVADDRPLLLQDFLDSLASYWGYSRPWRLPESFFFAAARGFDLFSRITGSAVPLNPDILRMGMTSSVADTSRLKEQIAYKLKYPTFEAGLQLC